MHQLVALLVTVSSVCLQEVLGAGQQPYPPLSSQPLPPGLYPPPFGPPVPPGPSKPFFTYAEVNTPYYHYHYYAPVYKKHIGEPPFLENYTPELPFRNEVNNYNDRGSSVPPVLFYPAQTPFDETKMSHQNDCTPPFCVPINHQRPSLISELQGVPFQNPKPLFGNQPYAPSFRTYQNIPPTKYPLFSLRDIPSTIPNVLTTDSPNIIREYSKEDPLSKNTLRDTPFTPLVTPVNPIYSSLDNPYQTNNPLFIPESLVTTSPTVDTDEIWRGTTFEADHSQVKNLSTKSNGYSNVPTPTTLETDESSKDSEEVEAQITYISFPQNSKPNLPSKSTTVRSIVLTSEIVVEDPKAENSDKSLFSNALEPSSPNSNETVSHTQKITPKIKPKKDITKHILKHPNVLFDAPGHDSPD